MQVNGQILIKYHAGVHLMGRFPLYALLGKNGSKRAPVTKAEAHSTGSIAHSLVALLFPATDIILPQLGAAYRVEIQHLAVLLHKLLVGDIFIIDVILQFFNMRFYGFEAYNITL